MRPELRNRAVVVLGKIPRAGRVKTRLSPAVSLELASRLYAAFLADVFSLVDAAAAETSVPFDRVFACQLWPGMGLEDAQSLAPSNWRVIEQRGESLGDRMEAARQDAAAEAVVILGSDAPTMPPQRITEAFSALQSSQGRRAVVLGPTPDGGYYLLGQNRAEPCLLTGIPWSTSEVLAITRAHAEARGIEVIELKEDFDIDRVEDLPRAWAAAHADSRTRALLSEILPMKTRS